MLGDITIPAQNYRTQTKHRKAKKGHGWTKLKRIKVGCILINLKNVSPTFLQVYLSVYQNVISTAGKSFLFAVWP